MLQSNSLSSFDSCAMIQKFNINSLRYKKGKVFMEKVIVIAGPTASGKTALAVELAKKINGEVISCDSMQIYRSEEHTSEL